MRKQYISAIHTTQFVFYIFVFTSSTYKEYIRNQFPLVEKVINLEY